MDIQRLIDNVTSQLWDLVSDVNPEQVAQWLENVITDLRGGEYDLEEEDIK